VTADDELKVAFSHLVLDELYVRACPFVGALVFTSDKALIEVEFIVEVIDVDKSIICLDFILDIIILICKK
jgi:hypothetical protein